MNIALSFPGCHRRGGVERIIYECARYLAGRGHDVTVFANDFEQNGAAITYHNVPVRKTLKTMQPVAFYDACKDAMRGESFDSYGSFGCVCPEGGVYWAQSVHAAWLEKAQALRPIWSLARWKQWLNPVHPVLLKMERQHFTRGNYKHIIALTDEVKADLMRHYGVPSDDIVVIPNGYAPAEFNIDSALAPRDQVRKELGIRADEKMIVFVANELDRKGYTALLNTLDTLNDPLLRLVVVGRIAPRPHPRVIYAGSTNQVARYYAAADLFALPTLYEAWGLVIVEAMATGLPVLTSRLAGASIAVKEGFSGQLLDDPRDESEIARKLLPLLNGGHATRAQISASVTQYAWDQVLIQYEDILTNSSSQVVTR